LFCNWSKWIQRSKGSLKGKLLVELVELVELVVG
jgi:hypothetical protein